MKTKSLLSLLSALYICLLSNAQLNYNWGKISTINPSYFSSDIHTAADGTLYCVYFSATGGSVIAKYNIDGTQLMELDLGCQIVKSAIDANQNIYVLGTYGGTVNFNPLGPDSIVVNPSNCGNTNTDFIAKYDSDGHLLWVNDLVQCFYYVIPTSLAVDNDGNVILTGYFTDTFRFYTSTNFLVPDGNAWDIFIAKYDTDGNFIWSKRTGAHNEDKAYDVTTDSAGNIIITGTFRYCTNFNPIVTNGCSVTAWGGNVNEGFIAKYDSFGNFMWFKQITNKSSGLLITVDNDDNIIASGSYPAFLHKYDASGNIIWSRVVNGFIYSINVDSANNVNVAGSFTDTVDFNAGYLNGIVSLVSAGQKDIFIANYTDSIGNLIFAHNIGSGRDDIGYSIATYNNKLYIAGTFSDTVNFDLNAGIANHIAFSDSGSPYLVSYDFPPASTEANIDSFSFPQQLLPAVIDTVFNTISIVMPYGSNLANLTPAFVLSPGSTSSPLSGIAQNFTGPFTYLVTAADGITQKNWVVTVSIANSIAENTSGLASIYPNPTQQFITVELPANAGKQLLIITNITGQIVYSETLVNTKNVVDINSLSPGIYLWKVGSKAGKLVIQ